VERDAPDVPGALHRGRSAVAAVPPGVLDASEEPELPGVARARVAGLPAADELERPRDAPAAAGGRYPDRSAVKAVRPVFSRQASQDVAVEVEPLSAAEAQAWEFPVLSARDKFVTDPGRSETSPLGVDPEFGDCSTPVGSGSPVCDPDFAVALVASDRSTGFDPAAAGGYRVVDNYAVGPCRWELAYPAVVVPRDVPPAVDRVDYCRCAGYFPAAAFHG